MHSFVVAIYFLLLSCSFAIPGRFIRDGGVLSVCTRKPGFVMSNTKPPFCTPQTIHFGPEHEMSQTLLTRRVLTPYRRNKDFITVDCGAAMGWYTLFWSKLGFDVLAFEPGTTAFLLDAIKLNPESQGVVTVHNAGLGRVDFTKGNGASTGNRDVPVHKSIGPFLPPGKEVAMMKIDVEGNEIFVLEDVLNLPQKFHNLLVEFTPKWWPKGTKHGEQVIDAFVASGWQFFASAWSEHAKRVGDPPYGLAPVGVQVNWSNEPLLFVQRIPPANVTQYILSIKFQRDVWMQHPQARFPLDLVSNQIDEIMCMKADEWRYSRMPSYLKDPLNTNGCYDQYHNETLS